MCTENKQAFQHLSEWGFGASLSGKSLHLFNGELITEHFNKLTKDTACPLLAIATTECSLRQSDKAHFRNHLISASLSYTNNIPQHCAWFVNGMAAIRSTKPKTTFKEFILSLIDFVTPQKEQNHLV